MGAAVGLPLAFLITAIIWIDEFPDLEADLAAAKRTPGLPPGPEAVPLGLCRPDAGALCQPLCPSGILPAARPHALPALVALPLALRAIRLVWRTAPTEPRIRQAQALTIQTHFFAGPDPNPGPWHSDRHRISTGIYPC